MMYPYYLSLLQSHFCSINFTCNSIKINHSVKGIITRKCLEAFLRQKGGLGSFLHVTFGSKVSISGVSYVFYGMKISIL